MKQWTRLMVLLAVPALVWGCKSDPTVPDTAGVAAKLVASPQTLFVPQGDSAAVSVTVTDVVGNPVPGTFSNGAPGDAGFTVRQDTTQGLIYDASGNLVQKSSPTSVRYIVAANALAASTFTVTSGDLSTTIHVTSVPNDLAATLTAGTSGVANVVTITPPAGLTFSPTARVTASATDSTTFIGNILSQTATEIVFNPIPGFQGPITVRGVVPAYAPTLNLNLTTTAEVTGLKIPGTDALATAPVLAIPAAGVITTFVDAPPFGYSGCTGDLGDNCNIYKITVAAPTSFHIKLDYDNESDMGAYFLDATGTAVDGSVGFADAAGVAAGPEESDITLQAGTYYLAVLRFTYDATDPAWYQVTLTGQ